VTLASNLQLVEALALATIPKLLANSLRPKANLTVARGKADAVGDASGIAQPPTARSSRSFGYNRRSSGSGAGKLPNRTVVLLKVFFNMPGILKKFLDNHLLGGIGTKSMAEMQWLEGHGGRRIDELIELAASYRIDSIVVAIEDALMSKADVSSAEEVVLAVEAMEREVNNGGFEQFFANSSKDFAPVLVSALERIGTSKTAEIARRAVKAISATPSWTPEQYEAAAASAGEAVLEELSACDAAYFSSGEAIADQLFEFIKRNREDINLGAASP